MDWALLLAPLLAACGHESQAGPDARVERIQLRTAPQAGVAAAETLLVVSVPEDLGGWTIESARHLTRSLDVGGSPQRFLHLQGDRPKSVRIPLGQLVTGLDRIRVACAVQHEGTLEIRAFRRGTEVTGAGVLVPARGGAVDVEVDLPLVAALGVDELLLTVPGEPAFAFASLRLESLPTHVRLPQIDTGADLVRVGDESRRAVGLTSARPLTTTVEVGPQCVLRFSYALPAQLRLQGQIPVLEVVATAPGRPEAYHRYSFEYGSLPSRWHTARLDFAEYEGLRVDLRFQLEAAGPSEAICALGSPSLCHASARAPTVLLITSDTHRADHLGASGSAQRMQTPELDALASRGVLFENCFSTTNITLPSHCAILTGVSPRDLGILENVDRLGRTALTLAESFREAGYLCYAAVSAAHLADEHSGLGQGFDRVSATDLAKREAGQTLAEVEGWLAETQGLPLFLWVHLFDAHTPYDPPPSFRRRYYPADRDPADPRLATPGVDPRHLPAFLPGIRDVEYPRGLYKGEINYLDSELARLLDRARFRSGVVAFTADHGESLGAHGVWWDHAELYPDSVHVPLLLSWPGAPQGLRIEEPVSNLDLGRTLLDLAGEIGREFPGSNLLDEERLRTRAPIFCLSAYGSSASITHEGLHGVLSLTTHLVDQAGVLPPKRAHAFELYDLGTDPGCTRDLARERFEVARGLRARLITWLLEAREQGWKDSTPVAAQVSARLKELGYLGGPVHDEPGVSGKPRIDPRCSCAECRHW